MTDYSFATVEEFIEEVARPEIERQLDELIATLPNPVLAKRLRLSAKRSPSA
jgi:hypothetical protein